MRDEGWCGTLVSSLYLPCFPLSSTTAHCLGLLQEGTSRPTPFAFATVKGFTGHQESAAGVVGLMEAALAVQHAALPPALHLRHLNPHTHGALKGHAVTIARGGPLGLPLARAAGGLTLGVSSFGAQGTNAHALVVGSGDAAAICVGGSGAGEEEWKRGYVWLGPRMQALLASAAVRRSVRGRVASATFECWLVAPRLAYLWQYGVYRKPHLSSTAVLSMAASTLPMLGPADAPSSSLLEVAMITPLPLTSWSRGKAALTATITVALGSGAVEVGGMQQRLLAGRASTTAGTRREQAASEAGTGIVPMHTSPTLASMLQSSSGSSSSSSKRETGAIHGLGWASTSTKEAAEGYVLHPALLDACVGQTTWAPPIDVAPLTWIRSIAAMVLHPAGTGAAGEPLSAAHAVATWHPDGPWTVGNCIMAAPTMHGGAGAGVQLQGVVIGEHTNALSSPGRALPPAPGSCQGCC